MSIIEASSQDVRENGVGPYWCIDEIMLLLYQADDICYLEKGFMMSYLYVCVDQLWRNNKHWLSDVKQARFPVEFGDSVKQCLSKSVSPHRTLTWWTKQCRLPGGFFISFFFMAQLISLQAGNGATCNQKQAEKGEKRNTALFFSHFYFGQKCRKLL